MNDSLPLIHVILGPTASGKTAYAIQQAKKLGNAAVISADSRQIYSFMDIGTAKPQKAWNTVPHSITEPDVIEEIDHYLLNIVNPNNLFTLSQWQPAAYAAIDHVLSQGKTPFLVGGTMLYIDSIVKNYTIPKVPPNPSYREHLESKEASTLFSLLLEKDPDAKKFIEPHHKQRIIRALEVIQATGKPFSALRQTQPPRYTFEITGLFPGWDVMKDRISRRSEEMLTQDLLKETQNLRERFSPDIPLLNTMNYVQAGAVLDKKISSEQAIDEMIKVNMKYAHRQMSWWKNSSYHIQWI